MHALEFPGLRISLLFALALLSTLSWTQASKICIVGGGVSGTSLAYFLSKESSETHEIHIFEKSGSLGGRIQSVEIDGEIFESGASIAHDKNYHLARMVHELGLEKKRLTGMDYGVWNGRKFIVRQFNEKSKWWPIPMLYNTLSFSFIYGTFHLKDLGEFVHNLLAKWLSLYDDALPAFTTPEDMLRHAGLFELTKSTLEEALLAHRVPYKIIDELVTAIIRIQYGQSANITALAGAVGLCGTGSALWQIKGGNVQLIQGLAQLSSAHVHLNSPVTAVTKSSGDIEAGLYKLTVEDGSTEECDAVAVAAPLAENVLNIESATLPPLRPFHHTHTTFVKGMINASYFGFKLNTSLPGMIGTMEDESIPFNSISRQHSEEADGWPVFKIFSRNAISDDLIAQIFSEHRRVLRVDWAAYPSYHPPEVFPPFLLDDDHLYYVNTFEGAASAMEALAVAARNVARLILTRFGEEITQVKPVEPVEGEEQGGHSEL